jgi:uncharacterized protein
MLDVMETSTPVLKRLSRAECIRLMGTVPIGRIVYTRQALPAVEVVNFALADGDIVIRTSAEGKLAAATRGAVVAFEADSVDLGSHVGWSVTAVGQARLVTGKTAEHLEGVALTPWAPGPHTHFICIQPTIVNGRWLGGEELDGDCDAHSH